MPQFKTEPEVRLVSGLERPFDNAVATARTCYSKGIVTPGVVAGDGKSDAVRDKRRARRDALAKSIFDAGHHTTLQHANFQFAMSGISRQAIWSFLHSHPYYNSEQVSQRYVEVNPGEDLEGGFLVPDLGDPTLQQLYENTIGRQFAAYQELIEVLKPSAAEAYFDRFPGRRKDAEERGIRGDIQKRAQEVARYVLPVATKAHMYHTVSALTLLRYYRMCQQPDVPSEQRAIAQAMIDEVLRVDPGFEVILQQPIGLEETVEYAAMNSNGPIGPKEYIGEFDAELGGKVSKLVDWSANGEDTLADSVRDVLGRPRSTMSDEEAISWVTDPVKSTYLAEKMNVTTHSKLDRALQHSAYTFAKRLSHTADSQDQRHRTTPASRPILETHYTGEPDFVTPRLMEESEHAEEIYRRSMRDSWNAVNALLDEGVPFEIASYLLPNALAIRFRESSNLLNLMHKARMRLCYNAQEEVWNAMIDEAEQVAKVHPLIGEALQPPCVYRDLAGTRPKCPEGPRFCGVKAWQLDRQDYERVI